MPAECFAVHHPTNTFALAGPLTVRQLDAWAEELAAVIDRYAAQAARCNELNQQRE
jgi:hypothetical protein